MLEACRACGNQISTEASACPQCGHPHVGDPKPQQERRGMGCGGLFLGITITALVAATVFFIDAYNSAQGTSKIQAPKVRAISDIARKRIFWESVEAEDRADAEAEAKLGGPQNINTVENLKRFGQEKNKLQERYLADVMKNHKISEQQLDAISLEGLVKKWPMPPH